MPLSPQSFPTVPVSPYDNDLRARLKTGDLLLCSGTGVFSELIQQATRSPWSHVALIVRLDAIERVMLFESVETVGVRAIPLSRYLLDYDHRGCAYPGGLVVVRHRTFSCQRTTEQIRNMLQFAVDQFGSAYNRQEIVRIAARIIASSFKPPSLHGKHMARQREYICSEYVAQCFAHAGVALTPQNHGYIAPADFASPQDTELLSVLKGLA